MNTVDSSGSIRPSSPLISVMIPVYEPNHYLQATLRSVLQQMVDFPAGSFQIAVIDDASSNVDTWSLIKTVQFADHVEFERNPRNLGLAGNWNRAIDLARGEFIHILHQDDVVLQGFYKTLSSALQQNPKAGMAFCRHAIIGANDEVQRVSHRERFRSGILSNWLARIAMRTRIQCPAAFVRRSTYQTVGQFRTDLKYSLDWEMWVRIATQYPVWYETRMLALYRRHAENESARLAASGAQEPDLLKTISIFSQYLPEISRAKAVTSAHDYLVRSRLKQSKKLIANNRYLQAKSLLQHTANAMENLPQGLRRWRYQNQWKKLASRIPTTFEKVD
jgi:glycosyltransferase involved in cell wall biosynthesis